MGAEVGGTKFADAARADAGDLGNGYSPAHEAGYGRKAKIPVNG